MHCSSSFFFVDFALANCQQPMASSILDRKSDSILAVRFMDLSPILQLELCRAMPCVDSEVPSAQSWLPMNAFELCRQPQHPFLSLVHGLNRVLKAVFSTVSASLHTVQNFTRTLSLYKK